MPNIKWLIVASGILFTACKGEPEPALFLEGQWRVQHEFDQSCQVGVTFTDKTMIVSFYELSDAACRTPSYGIKNHVLELKIDEREDFYSDQGRIGARLKVSAPSRGSSGSLTLWQTDWGLAGAIEGGSESDAWLMPLLGTTYRFTALPLSWGSDGPGPWGMSQAYVSGDDSHGEICPLPGVRG